MGPPWRSRTHMAPRAASKPRTPSQGNSSHCLTLPNSCHYNSSLAHAEKQIVTSPAPKGEAKSLAEALTKSRGLFPQQRVVKMILPPITAESPRSNHAIQEMRYEMKHHEKLLGIF